MFYFDVVFCFCVGLGEGLCISEWFNRISNGVEWLGNRIRCLLYRSRILVGKWIIDIYGVMRRIRK